MKIQELKGVGPKIVKHLNSLGLYTVKDAIEFYPRNYEDRNNFKPIPLMQDAEMVSIIARVSIIQPGRRTATGKFMNKVVFESDTGFVVGVWFNQPYIKNNFTVGDTVLLYGKISRKLGEIQIIEPLYEKDFESSSRGILPVYSSNKYLSQKNLRKIISQALAYIDREVDECLPESIRRVYELPDIKSAIVNLHYPSDFKMLNISEKRIKFEELLILQLALFSAKQQYTNFNNAYSIQIHSSLRDFKESLPFELTGAQSRTIREVLMDLKKIKPMNRLVQGDVGSGKTIVAITALFNCAMNGFQGAMMAPTEILAEQHYKSIEGLTSKWGIKTALITGSTPKKEKDRILHELALGEIKIVIGTHALIQENVGFYNLALVITDEQHRFGVRQRAELISKGHDPHVLVMTATPIPRTLALFLYGDMDISIIDELPPGRQKIETRHTKTSSRDRVYNWLKGEIDKGRQAYVVCPLVEESEKLEAESAVETEKMLKEKYFMKYQVGLIHGKMSSREKDEVMTNFRDGVINILVSTTVIEVGVNVPNATVMIVENADRFGLAQLHQLRGRVGRGEHKSYCVLISDSSSGEVAEKMNIMVKTNDGFIIAEKDMELRGTGEFFGTRQHGLPELKKANLIRDFELLKITRDIAREIMEKKYFELSEYDKLRKIVNDLLNEKLNNVTFN